VKATSTAWPTVRVAELQAPKRYALNGGPFGSKLVSSDYVPEGVPVIRGANLPEDSRFSVRDFVFVSELKADELLPNNAHPGDLVFTQRGTLGQVGLIPRASPFCRYVISQSQMKLTVDEKRADVAFLYYYFRAPRTVEQIHNLAFSTGVPHINLDILRNFEVRLPPLPVQKIIRALLWTYDDLIENNTRRIRILEEMAQAVYREWFVHFRFPGHKKVKLVPSSLGPIPERWEANSLGNVSLNFDRLRKPVSKMQRTTRRGPYPYYGAARVFDFIDDFIFDGEYLLVAEDGSVITADRMPVLQLASGRFWANNHTHIIQGKPPVSTEYLYLRLCDLDISGYITGAAQPKVTQENLNRIPVLVPSNSVLDQFDSVVCDSFVLLRTLKEKNRVLQSTCDLLLPKLISGEVDVSELDIDVGDVAV